MRSSQPRKANSWTVEPYAKSGLLAYLVDKLGGSRRAAKRWLDERVVFVNGRRVWMAKHELRMGDRVEIVTAAARPDTWVPPNQTPKLPVLVEDAQFIVVDKPSGIVANEERGSAEFRLRDQLGEPGITAVHRLDRDTSGCLLMARSPAARETLVRLFKRRLVRKVYRAIVVGHFPREMTHIDAPVDGQPARSQVRVRAWGPCASEVEVVIETGRTHQIRQHLWSAEFPVAGDRQYGASRPLPEMFRSVPRQLLHAWQLEFPNPVEGGKPVRAQSPLPADYLLWLKRLGLEAQKLPPMTPRPTPATPARSQMRRERSAARGRRPGRA